MQKTDVKTQKISCNTNKYTLAQLPGWGHFHKMGIRVSAAYKGGFLPLKKEIKNFKLIQQQQQYNDTI